MKHGHGSRRRKKKGHRRPSINIPPIQFPVGSTVVVLATGEVGMVRSVDVSKRRPRYDVNGGQWKDDQLGWT